MNFPGCATGAFVNGPENLSNFQQKIGKKLAVVLWYIHWLDPFPNKEADIVYANGSVPLITWEPWITHKLGALDAIATGCYEDYVKRFIQAAKDWGKPIFLRFAHEMNGNWYPWSGVRIGRDKYIACYRYVKDIFDTQGVVNVKWVFSVNWEDVPKEKNNFLLYYPGDNYVAYVGIDGYNWGTTKAWSRWMTFRGIFARRYKEIINDIHKPVIITEFGSASKGGDKAVWIRDAMAEIKRMREIKAFVLFNVDKETDWRFPASSRAGRELKKVLADEYFRDTGMLLK